MRANKPNEWFRFSKFLIVGGLNTFVDFGLMNLFTAVFHFPLVQAQAISFVAAVTNSYILNRKWVYPDSTDRRIGNQFGKFFSINLAGLALRSLTIPLIDQMFFQLIKNTNLNIGNIKPELLSHNAALAIVIPLTLILNYFANRYWTFGDVNGKK